MFVKSYLVFSKNIFFSRFYTCFPFLRVVKKKNKEVECPPLLLQPCENRKRPEPELRLTQKQLCWLALAELALQEGEGEKIISNYKSVDTAPRKQGCN